MTDEQLLINSAQRGDTEAFRELVERSKINVYRLAYDLTGNSHDAEDLSQEVFIKAHRALPGFRGDSKWATWLYRITVNTCYDHRETKSRRPMEYREDIGNTDSAGESDCTHNGIAPDKSAEAGMIQENIERALDTLTPQERSVFVLRHYHDLPLKEIASTLSLAEGTVKSYLFRALRRLQQELAFYKNDLGLEK